MSLHNPFWTPIPRKDFSLERARLPRQSRVSVAFGIVLIYQNQSLPCTYGHSQLKTGHPVRSAIHKQLNGRLVLRWVTTWESLLLYVLFLSFKSPTQPGLSSLKRSESFLMDFEPERYLSLDHIFFAMSSVSRRFSHKVDAGGTIQSPLLG